MVNEVVELLNLGPGKVIVDATVGEGGHALAILRKITPGGRLIGIDRDREVLEVARKNLAADSNLPELVCDNFRILARILEELEVRRIDGILFDLGVSSFQLNSPSRGFSFRLDGPLDMRMDQNDEISAFDLVNNLTAEEIESILRNFGEERWAGRIARRIFLRRKKSLITRTRELAELIEEAVPFYRRYSRIDPATRTFQALRIAVNQELEALPPALRSAVDHLAPGGRIGVISFHSLEDRIVKHEFRKMHEEGKVELVTRKPLRPTANEELSNPRSRSAKLRIAEKINEDTTYGACLPAGRRKRS